MKKLIIIIFLLFLSSFVLAQEFRPSTVKTMDVTITSEATGSFAGTITRGDELEIFFITIQEEPKQELISLEEYMEIGGEIIKPVYIERDELKYAQYKISDLYNYAKTNTFKLIRKARIKRTSSFGLGEDYNLKKEITEFSEFKKATGYIEVDDQELRSKVSLEFNSDSQIETVRQITEWVNNNIEYDFENYYDATYSAKETYNSRAGVCDEFANLTAAFTRIKGIPTKYVTGISFDGERFGLHGWLEVYLPGTGWIGVDSTYGEAGYLDAAHFTIAKTTDANKAIDLIAITRSREPITITTNLDLPKVEINSVEFFENLTEVKLNKPEQVSPEELFKITAEIKNISGKKVIMPIGLVLHEKFSIENNEKLVFFEIDETKTITWEARAPNEKVEGGYYTYGLILLLPDENISDTIKVIPSKDYTDSGANIRVKDVSPFINEKNLELKIILENLGNGKGSVFVEILFEGNQVEANEIILHEFEEKNLDYIVRNIRPGKITVKINTPEEKVFEIQIPEKEETLVVQVKEPEESTFEENGNTIPIIAIVSGLLLGLVILLMMALRK
ncbi:MAG: transglutaminase-like domain-containing protein [archaeon]|nr:transglutaminase-like domain-containing protein [archaeon]